MLFVRNLVAFAHRISTDAIKYCAGQLWILQSLWNSPKAKACKAIYQPRYFKYVALEKTGGGGLSAGEIAGIAVGSVAGVVLIIGGLYYGYTVYNKDAVKDLTKGNKVTPSTPQAEVHFGHSDVFTKQMSHMY